jgi:hypothetical protein
MRVYPHQNACLQSPTLLCIIIWVKTMTRDRQPNLQNCRQYGFSDGISSTSNEFPTLRIWISSETWFSNEPSLITHTTEMEPSSHFLKFTVNFLRS